MPGKTIVNASTQKSPQSNILKNHHNQITHSLLEMNKCCDEFRNLIKKINELFDKKINIELMSNDDILDIVKRDIISAEVLL